MVGPAAVVDEIAPLAIVPSPGMNFRRLETTGRPRKVAPRGAGNRRDERAEERPGDLDPEGSRNTGEHVDLNRNQYQGIGERYAACARPRRHRGHRVDNGNPAIVGGPFRIAAWLRRQPIGRTPVPLGLLARSHLREPGAPTLRYYRVPLVEAAVDPKPTRLN